MVVCDKEICVILTILCVTFCASIDDGVSQNGPKELEEIDNQDWTPLEPATPRWSEGNTEQPPPRRRRIRKRKRRPQIHAPPELEEDIQFSPSSRKRLRPHRPEELPEPWEAMQEDSYKRPYTRRRITPQYEDDTHNKEPSYEKVRDPFTALQEAEEKIKLQKKKLEETTIQPSDTTIHPKLKSVLKQTGGLSLSELLQQKNLTLAELLKGDPHALSALTEKSTTRNEIVSEYNNAVNTVAIKQINSITSRNFDSNDSSFENTTPIGKDTQKKKLTLSHGYKENKFYTDLHKFDVFSEPTTERRVFVPSHPKYLSSEEENIVEDIKPLVSTTPKIIPEIITIKRKEIITNRMSLKPKLKMPIWSTTTTKATVINEENYPKPVFPSKAIKININELFGINTVKTTAETNTQPGPIKMMIDIEKMTSKTEESSTEKSTPDVVSEKTSKNITAKEELMEILKDPISREKLARILDLRNMTLEELILHRERGSSQLHLADIFHSRTKEPEPKDEPHIGQIIPINFQTPPKEIPTKDMRIIGEAVDVGSPVKTEQTINNPKPSYTVTSFPTYKIEMDKEIKLPPFFPAWQTLYPNAFPDIYESNNKEAMMEYTDDDLELNGIQRLEDIENKIADSVNEKLNIDVLNNYPEEVHLPSGVKSAILASSVIVGISLIVFLTIFVMFRWSQKQKKLLNYTNSFSGSRLKSPILEESHRRSIKTIMNETLGRSKPHYKAYVPGMSDISWEHDKKPYL